MSNAQTVNRVTVVPNVRVGPGQVQNVRFVVKRNRIVVRSRGLPLMTIKQGETGGFTASIVAMGGKLARRFQVEAKNPASAFVKGVHEFWAREALI